ncbi:MAG: TolC family protein [Alphaproteobacteria bacterium]|nr:TolC family protein [Alphaproteobacteria bacterium]
MVRARLITLLFCFLTSGCALRPEVLSLEQLSAYSDDKRWRTTIDQEPLNGPLSLYEAMARALKYNLDHRVEMMEVALREQQLSVAHFSLLPNIVANSGYDGRNNYSGGSSVELLNDNVTGQESLRSSTSSDKDIKTTDITFSWHILDFGLSYIRARQASDQVLISNERRRKVINRIIEDVRTAYWKAVAADRTMSQLRQLNGRVEEALANSRKLSQRADASPLTALTYERELREIQREMGNLESELTTAKAQLAALVNVSPGESFRVEVPHWYKTPRILGMSADAMIEQALVSRSELREVAYNARINRREAEAAILEMLPGISLDTAPNFNSNDFLFNQYWVTWGAKASWNLIKVFSYPARRAEVDAKDELLDARALAVTMAIMTQVHVSRARLIHARRKYRVAQDFFDVQNRILRQIRAALDAGKVSEQTAIREEMNTLVARVKLDLAFVELQNAFANAFASVGQDPFEDGLLTGEETVRELEVQLRDKWRALGDRHAYLESGVRKPSVRA